MGAREITAVSRFTGEEDASVMRLGEDDAVAQPRLPIPRDRPGAAGIDVLPPARGNGTGKGGSQRLAKDLGQGRQAPGAGGAGTVRFKLTSFVAFSHEDRA